MVQITPDGLPIVLMADCQTTGGYPVIGVLTPPDLGALARKTPGTEVSFQEISEAESERIARSFSDSVGLRIRGGR
jgi:allophanate hydrolase subunit 2